jgi:eukaryotic-like serine/threonine-protein kinase
MSDAKRSVPNETHAVAFTDWMASERVGLSGAEPLQYCQAVPAVLRAVRGGQSHPEPRPEHSGKRLAVGAKRRTIDAPMSDDLSPLREALADRYDIERLLGEGGMATVYVARDVRHNRRVALKVLKPDLAAVVGAQRFLNEIQVTANLQHPHILGLYDSGTANGAPFYVMPLVQGESLRDRLTRETMLPIADTIRIAQQVAGALEYAHRHGVIHRDIKPENILLQDGEVLLGDFGIALAVHDAAVGRLTGTGLSLGTVGYMSPEQASGERDLDARTDIYSLGAVVYEMLAGEPPFRGPTAQATIAKLMTERPTGLRVVRDGVPPALEQTVMRALAKAPADRFASAREFADALAGSPTAPVLEPAARDGLQGTRRSLNWAAGLAAVVFIVAGIVMLLRGRTSTVGDVVQSGAATIRSIAVLPLDNYSGDSTQDYFAEGMTDELTAALATISQLRVTSRGSAMQFQGKQRPATPDIGKRLGVDAVVEGSVVRSGDKVRITASLIDARADKHLWTQSFESNSRDILSLQADLASAIARQINVQLTEGEQSRLASAQALNPEAHDAYLKGRYFFNRPSDENLKKAIDKFEEAVKLNPTFAQAYSGLSDAYLWAGYNEGIFTASQAKPKAKAAAEKAVQLDSNSAEAHASLATFKMFYEFDWKGSEQEFRKSIALNPNYAFAHDQFGMALAFTGRYDESIAEGRRAAALDPLSPQVLVDATMALFFKKDFPAARELATKAAELDPTYFFPVMAQGWVDMEAGRFPSAIALLKKSTTMGAPPFVYAYLGYTYGVSGDRANALAQLDTLKKLSAPGPVLPFNLALIHLGLGDKQRAITELEAAHVADSQMLAWLGRDAMFDSLRPEPRFQSLLKQLNFVEP